MIGEYIYIFKYTDVRSKYYNTWAVEKGHGTRPSEMISDEILFRAKTRKECRQFAEKNGLDITFMDSGRTPMGCKW